jgi:hypothetical protein
MLNETRPWFGTARRLLKRGGGCDGLTVDLDGVTLGSDFQLVRRTPECYRAITRVEVAALLQAISRKGNPERLHGHLESIAKALNAKDLAKARILGLYFPINELTAAELARLSNVSAVLKQNFNPDQPRDEHGRWGSGGLASSGKIHPARNRALPPNAAREESHAKEPVST